MKYNGVVLEKKDLPQFPLKGCDNIYGCRVDVESFYEKSEDDDFCDETDDETFDLQTTNNPVQMLKILKEMLDDGLITQEDYDKKKHVLLDNM
jgi:hypothetical protein